MQILEKQSESYCIMVEPFMIEDMWPKCIHFLENPDIGGEELASLDEAKELCRQGLYQLWILMEEDELKGCFFTNFGEASPGKNIINIFWLCGDGVKTWVHAMDQKMCEWARANGCKHYVCTARKGFARLVPELKDSGTIYVREV